MTVEATGVYAKGNAHKPAVFMLDWFESPDEMDDPANWFAGFTTGQWWNGWACPFFAKPEADRFMAANSKEGTGWVTFYYDAKRDAYIVHDKPITPEERENPESNEDIWIFEGIKCTIDGQETVLYAIGAWGWCWLDVTKEATAANWTPA